MYRIRYHTAKTDEELTQVLKLQSANLPDQLTEEETEAEGFVTVAHTLELLRAMNDKCPHILAKSGNLVVGYALCMHPDFKADIDVLKPMFREIEKLLPKEESYIIMGQVCISKTYRKQGIFRGLYEKMKAATQDAYSRIITEVDHRNQRSLQAHFAAGFRELSQYESGGRLWHLIYLK